MTTEDDTCQICHGLIAGGNPFSTRCDKCLDCEHLLLDQIGEPYLKGLSDFIRVACVACRFEMEVEVSS